MFPVSPVDPAATAAADHSAPDPLRAAAERLQAAFFLDLLKHGGFADALSTGSGPLDTFTGVVLERVAEDLARGDRRLAEQLYLRLARQTDD